MNILVTISSIIEKYSTPSSRRRINNLIGKKKNKLGKLYLYLEAGLSEKQIAQKLGYKDEKDKTFRLLKKRLRLFLEDTVKLCALTGKHALDQSHFERLTDIMNLVRVMRREENQKLTHYYCAKAIKMAEESGHMEIWLDCLKTDMLYYHHMGNMQLMNEAEQQTTQLIQDISTINKILTFILREEMLLRTPKPYDPGWDEKTISLDNEIQKMSDQIKDTHNPHVRLALVTAELFVAVRLDDGHWPKVAQRGFDMINGNINITPTFTLFIYMYTGVSYVMKKDFEALEVLYKYIAPICSRYPVFHFNFSTLRVSALLLQQRFDDAYTLFMMSMPHKLPQNDENQDFENRYDYAMLVFKFLLLSKKLPATHIDMSAFVRAEKKSHKLWQQDIRVYRVVLLYLCLIDIASDKMTSAQRSVKKLRTHLDAYPLGKQTVRVSLLTGALEQYVAQYPYAAEIKKNSHPYISALKKSDQARSSDEFFSYLDIWTILLERLN